MFDDREKAIASFCKQDKEWTKQLMAILKAADKGQQISELATEST
jgi:hypothetical protein